MHYTIIVKDESTQVLIRLNDSLEVTEALLDKLHTNNLSSKIMFDRKDITNKVSNLNVINQWSLDDWIHGFRARTYLTIEDNRRCSQLMNKQKRESITLRKYLC